MRTNVTCVGFVVLLLSGIGSVVGAGPPNEPAADSLRMGVSAGDGKPSFVPNELIVLLDHGSIVPTPEGVVEAVAQRRPVPGELGIGNPVAARFVISERAGEAARAYLVENPDSPEAILQRYVVLTYPPVVDVDKVAFALAINRNVRWVGKNTLAQLSVTEPNDPLFDDNPGGSPRPPQQHQWGSYSLHLHEAWDYAKGHAYVGIVDMGVDTDHPDLRAFDASGNFIGGNFRPHLSRDYGYDDDNVDEGQAQGTQTVSFAGHGTHVAGIVGATPSNSLGVAGACWHCSLLISKVSQICSDGSNLCGATADIVDGINGAIERGAQILNLSLGYRPGGHPDCAATPLDPFCKVLELLENRDAVMAAAAGNDGTSASDWPAVDSRVIGAGGIAPGGAFWNDCPGFECGSNSDPNQLVTPAKQILSTFYEGLPYSPSFNCSDSVDGILDGFGPCTGTSMSSPYLAGSAGILRSINPLLTKANIRSLFISNLENPPGWNTANGLGKPNVHLAVQAALGRVGGQVLTNRLTPLFSMYSFQAEDHFYTTFPQMGAAAVWSSGGPDPGIPDGYWREAGYSSIGPDVAGYGYFPDTRCVVSPCPPEPGASVYVFTTDRSPNGMPLVPLYRLSFNGTNPNNPANAYNRDTTYTTEAAGIAFFRSTFDHNLDGVEGYIYQKCTPEPSCIPAGAVRLYRLYNWQRDDFAIFPESELASMVSQGYTSFSGLADVLGYVYPNVDSDGDRVINGFEILLGTDPLVADSDCDGLSDGVEILDFPYASKDPRSGSLAILELQNQSISSTQTFEACDTIFAGPNLTIEPSGNVTLHAGKQVVLRAGFRVKSGAVFRAVVP